MLGMTHGKPLRHIKMIKINPQAGNRSYTMKEDNMKRQSASRLVGTHFFLECGWLVPHMDGETVDDTLLRIYGTFVDNYINKCEAKAEHLDSGDHKIHRRAMRAKVKAEFMQSYRTLLINHLAEENVPFKSYLIEYHLNWKYAELVRPQDVFKTVLKESVSH
jgi:hypothetical protein